MPERRVPVAGLPTGITQRNRIGFVTGLAAEAQLLRRSGFRVEIGGGEPEGAYRAAEALLAQGVDALVSFGLAGGLARELVPGAVLVPDAVIDGGQTYSCDDALMAFLGGCTHRPLLAGRKIAASAGDKALLYRRVRADAIDLESGAVARAAAARGVPFAVLRAIADPATRNLPPAALIPMKPGGGIDLAGILRAVLRHPGQVPGLIALGRDANMARKALIARLARLG
jgi:adenosylhomocysteine nucleosidase